jgi:alkylhydroperoxidase/carboxymuconolactone decarboxylase family protein YurZ
VEAVDKRISEAVELAEEAFWASVAGQYPEITTGEFDPMSSYYLREALESAVREWVAVNSREEA